MRGQRDRLGCVTFHRVVLTPPERARSCLCRDQVRPMHMPCFPQVKQALLLRHAARGDREEAENLRAHLHAEGQVLDEASVA